MNAIPTKVDDNRFITDFDQKRVSIFENPGVLFGSSGVNSREFHFACWKWKKKKKKGTKMSSLSLDHSSYLFCFSWLYALLLLIEFNTLLVKFITVPSPFILQVVRKFRSIFSKQQTMRTFPVYDTEASRSDKWGMLDPTRALKKRANWIPFLKVTVRNFPFLNVLVKCSNQSSGCTKIYFKNKSFFFFDK